MQSNSIESEEGEEGKVT